MVETVRSADTVTTPPPVLIRQGGSPPSPPTLTGTAPIDSTLVNQLKQVAVAIARDTDTEKVDTLPFGKEGVVAIKLVKIKRDGITDARLVFEATDKNDVITVKPDTSDRTGKTVIVSVNGEAYKVTIDYNLKDNNVTVTLFNSSGAGGKFTAPIVGFGPIIQINANGGDDTVTVDPKVKFPIAIKGGKGNDKIKGGSGNDELEGDEGDDEIDGGNGINYIDGGAGHNKIKGGKNYDVIYGEAGDTIIDTSENNFIADGTERTKSQRASGELSISLTSLRTLGQNVYVEGSAEFKARVEKDLQSPHWKEMLTELGKTGKPVIIVESHFAGGSKALDITIGQSGPVEGSVILYNPRSSVERLDVSETKYLEEPSPPSAVLYHESVHSWNSLTSTTQTGVYKGSNQIDKDQYDAIYGVANKERQVVGLGTDDPQGKANPEILTENGFRKKLGLSKRVRYIGVSEENGPWVEGFRTMIQKNLK